jgi:hypothetical protein
MDDTNFISIREFARRLGVADTSVHKAIKAQKISKGIDYSNTKKPIINYKIAIREWKNNRSTMKVRDTTPISSKPKVVKVKPIIEAKPIISVESEVVEYPIIETVEIEDESETDSAKPIKLRNSAEFNEAKRVEAIIKARTAQLEYEELKGSLVNSKDVYKELFAVGQTVRSAMQAIPDKYIDNILACDTRQEASDLLNKAISQALEELSNAVKDVEI